MWRTSRMLPNSIENIRRHNTAARRNAQSRRRAGISFFISACHARSYGRESSSILAPAPRAAYRSARTSSLRKITVSCVPPATSCIRISRIGTLPPGAASVSAKKTTMAENVYPAIDTTRHTGTRLRESVRSVQRISAGTRTREPV